MYYYILKIKRDLFSFILTNFIAVMCHCHKYMKKQTDH